MIRHPPRPDLAAAILVSLGLLLSGCSDSSDGGGGPAGTSRSASTPSVGSTVPHLIGDSTPLVPGTYQFSVKANPGWGTPDALVEVPSGFKDGDDVPGFYVVSRDGDAFLGLWTIEHVQSDACLRPQNDLMTPGPSVEDLAEALVAQKSTDASAPEPVTLAGYRGLYVELASPRDVSKCDQHPGLWGDPGSRGIYSDDQVDLLWILDVDGQRLVVDAAYGPTATTSELDELTSMVKSLEFISAGD
jgi:hypothetical protein